MKNSENQYWSSLEELKGTPEFLEKVSREFPEGAGDSPFEVNRRDFLKLMGASLLMSGVACARRPVEKIIPYVNKPEEITQGVATWYASTCQECAASCGIVVKTREGRPIKLEGNNVHPVNQGALCARGQASILNLYALGRYETPLAQSVTDGQTKKISWDEVDTLTKEKLKLGKVALLTGVINSPSTRQLIEDFKTHYPNSVHVSYDPTVPEEIALGQELAYGQKLTPRYRLDHAKILVSFGADFLGTYLSPVEFTKQFTKARRVDEKKMSRFIAFEGQLSLSGTNADEYHAVKSGDELLVALALANEIIIKQKKSAYAGDAQINSFLLPYSAESIAAQTGVAVTSIQKTANDLVANKGFGLVLGGALKSKNATELQVVVNLINSALENDGATVDWSLYPSNQAASSFGDLVKLIDEMKAGKIATLIIDKVDPVYLLPKSLGFEEAIQKVSFVLAHAEQANATTAKASVIAASNHYLENWNDASPQRGLFSLAQPVVAALYQTRSLQDSLLKWSDINYSWNDYLKNYWKEKIYTLVNSGVPFEIFWIEALQKGVVDSRAIKGTEPDRLAVARSFNADILSQLKVGTQAPELSLALYDSVGMADGRSIGNPWLQELPDPVSKVVWDNYLSVSPKLADQMSLVLGDVVRVKGENFSFDAPVLIQPKMHEKSVAIGFGYGHQTVGTPKEHFSYLGGDLGTIGQNVGVNVSNAQQAGAGSLVWSGIAVSMTKTGKKHELAITQGHHTMENRPIVQDTTFEEFLKNPAAGIEGHEEDITLWPEHVYKGNKWGMSIDMSACTGCNACMIGCQVENNVPVVGKEQVLKGRDMHWIRVDRYYKGDVDQPEVAYQPMLCQQCDNAPCETVCPVLATMHNDEGLNVMVYNRCVGTRYCANNCPYKVRRFNFFEYTEEMVSPLNMVLNPDLTVRSQGVMEKCTFCWQRVRETKDYAKDQGREVRDGEIRTACQQTCPSDAIVFGNLNDPSSRVSRLSQSQRGYHVLEFLNTKPQVTYLTKIRNTGTI